jgi:hypothetical protein
MRWGRIMICVWFALSMLLLLGHSFGFCYWGVYEGYCNRMMLFLSLEGLNSIFQVNR